MVLGTFWGETKTDHLIRDHFHQRSLSQSKRHGLINRREPVQRSGADLGTMPGRKSRTRLSWMRCFLGSKRDFVPLAVLFSNILTGGTMNSHWLSARESQTLQKT